MSNLFWISAAQVVKDSGDGPHSAATLLARYGWTFARADATSCATYIDKDGILRLASANSLRIQYDDLNGDGIRETAGFVLEGPRTNYLLHSEEMNDAVWAKTNITVTSDNTIAPDGSSTADKVAATASAATTFSQSVVASDLPCAAYSVFAKKGSGNTDANRFGVRNTTSATDLIIGTLNYGTGVWSYITGSTGVVVQSLSGGWYRLTFSIPVGSGISIADTVQYYAGFTGASETAGEYSYIWGGQVQRTPWSSSYVKTVASSVARAADSLTIPFVFAPMEMTIAAKFTRPLYVDIAGPLAEYPGIFTLGTGNSGSMEAAFATTTLNLYSEIRTGSVASASPPAGNPLSMAAQFTGFPSAAKTRLDFGSGFGSYGNPIAFSAFGNQTLTVGQSLENVSLGSQLNTSLIELKARPGLNTLADMLSEPGFSPVNPFEVTDFEVPGPLISKAQSGRVNVRATQQIGRTWTEHYLLNLQTASHREFLARMRQYWANGTIFTKSHVDYLVPKGTGGGVPLVKGASQAGSTLIVDGCPANTPNWLRAGDIFRIAALSQAFEVAADVTTEADGRAVLSMVRPIFTGGNPTDNASLTISGVVLDVILLEPPTFPTTSGTGADWGELVLKFSEAL